MAETVGTLADKLTTVQLKRGIPTILSAPAAWKSSRSNFRTRSMSWWAAALAGKIPSEKLTFAANKVYKKDGNVIPEFEGTIGEMFSQLA